MRRVGSVGTTGAGLITRARPWKKCKDGAGKKFIILTIFRRWSKNGDRPLQEERPGRIRSPCEDATDTIDGFFPGRFRFAIPMDGSPDGSARIPTLPTCAKPNRRKRTWRRS